MNRAAVPHRFVTGGLHEIVRIILPAYPHMEEEQRAEVERAVTLWVATQIESMAGHLHLPFAVALVAFDLLPLLRYGRRFRALPTATRANYLEGWSNAPVPPMRDFVRLIRSSALFAYFDDPYVRSCLEDERMRRHVASAGEAS